MHLQPAGLSGGLGRTVGLEGTRVSSECGSCVWGGGWEERGTGTSFAGRALGGLSLIPTLLLEMEGGGGLECEGGAAGENHVDSCTSVEFLILLHRSFMTLGKLSAVSGS